MSKKSNLIAIAAAACLMLPIAALAQGAHQTMRDRLLGPLLGEDGEVIRPNPMPLAFSRAEQFQATKG